MTKRRCQLDASRYLHEDQLAHPPSKLSINIKNNQQEKKKPPHRINHPSKQISQSPSPPPAVQPSVLPPTTQTPAKARPRPHAAPEPVCPDTARHYSHRAAGKETPGCWATSLGLQQVVSVVGGRGTRLERRRGPGWLGRRLRYRLLRRLIGRVGLRFLSLSLGLGLDLSPRPLSMGMHSRAML
jgi:hypothetical protein